MVGQGAGRAEDGHLALVAERPEDPEGLGHLGQGRVGHLQVDDLGVARRPGAATVSSIDRYRRRWAADGSLAQQLVDQPVDGGPAVRGRPPDGRRRTRRSGPSDGGGVGSPPARVSGRRRGRVGVARSGPATRP